MKDKKKTKKSIKLRETKETNAVKKNPKTPGSKREDASRPKAGRSRCSSVVRRKSTNTVHTFSPAVFFLGGVHTVVDVSYNKTDRQKPACCFWALAVLTFIIRMGCFDLKDYDVIRTFLGSERKNIFNFPLRSFLADFFRRNSWKISLFSQHFTHTMVQTKFKIRSRLRQVYFSET